MMQKELWNRRDALRVAVACGLLPNIVVGASGNMSERPIPRTGEKLPVVGLGTWQVFDVIGSESEMEVRREIVSLLVENGGSLIDSSPMYARSEEIVGDVIRAENNRGDLFLATKVWTNGKASGESQMRRSLELMATEKMDLMQVHNLRDLDVHMRTIRQWQSDGLIRYSGVTDYRASALDEIEEAMRTYAPDFIQINYSLAERDADKLVLPLAQELGIAVLINRPFVSGGLFRAVGNRSLPSWAEYFAASWGQFFLKYIISHPAVTCVIPATSKAHHMIDNLGAGFGELPDDATRQRMAAYIDDL